MKPFVLILLLCSLQAGAAELPMSPASRTAWFSGLQDLRSAMGALNGLGENMANRPGANLARLKDLTPSQQQFELLEAASGKRRAVD